jgi:DNA-binding NarL/FixJ family response regulator
MRPKLSPEEIVSLHVLKTKGQSNSQIAHTLGVSEAKKRGRGHFS